MEVEAQSPPPPSSGSPRHRRSLTADNPFPAFLANAAFPPLPLSSNPLSGSPLHLHSNSASASLSSLGDADGTGKIMETTIHGMPPRQLADLMLSDPKRAKRIIANRKSAARSKEKKAFYMNEIERKFKALKNEAITLSTQLIMLQKECEDLTTANTKLKFGLQAMVQQNQRQDVVNAALREEVEVLRIATSDIGRIMEAVRLERQNPTRKCSCNCAAAQQQASAGQKKTPLLPPIGAMKLEDPIPADFLSLGISKSTI